ncbi:MAG TPA: hypothetical protein VGO61_03670 [Steroidobacteraceae bacterium]|jgi:hypothetical protein|nr:hypothetical protein [Steroidobacteraceae bacterium]
MNTRIVSVLLAALLLPTMSPAQTARYPLNSTAGLRPHNVVVEPATLRGKKGLKVMASAESPQSGDETLVLINDLEFGDGVIEAEISGEVRAGAPEGARGFVGIAFRVQNDLRTYDAFYLRPTNGRADDQVRRNHSAQYISHPDWPWFRLRKEFPSKYESYVDLVAGTWTKVRIEVHGEQARLYVHDMKQPTLIVSDVKSGANARGAIALWIDSDTVAHFRNLVVSGK